MTLQKEILPNMLEKRNAQKALNVWCGASSSGQEPYTIAMIMRENFPELINWKLTFWATDVSPSMLKRCNEGVYTQIEVNRGLPAPLMIKYFKKDGAAWILADEIRNMIDFRLMNLIHPWPLMPRFDIVFMRNVLIYFDAEVKRKILEGIRKNIADDGYLFLGTAESMVGVYDGFKHESLGKSMVYRPV
jgi:chemotaxis protein methyltransferase CheR